MAFTKIGWCQAVQQSLSQPVSKQNGVDMPLVVIDSQRARHTVVTAAGVDYNTTLIVMMAGQDCAQMLVPVQLLSLASNHIVHGCTNPRICLISLYTERVWVLVFQISVWDQTVNFPEAMCL